jgi:hypothetical protein
MGAGPAVVAVAGVAMLAWTWGTWPDVLVDFGRELYVAWQLAEGRRLYADLAYFNGPLSPYLNALWFRLFGVSLRTLVAANLVVLTLVTLLFYRIVREIAGRLAAAAAGVTFLVLFACIQLVRTGNYNFVCPYSHEMTHGLLLALAAVYALSRLPTYGAAAAAAGGLALGLVLLTKPEVGVAAVSAAVVAVAASFGAVRHKGATAATLVGATLVPPLAAVVLLAATMPFADALAGALGGWRWIVRRELASTPFYRLGMGTHDPGASLVTLLEASGLYALTFGPLALLALRRSLTPVRKVAGLAAVLGLALVLWQYGPIDWFEAARPLPLASAVLVFAAAVRARRPPTEPATILELSMAVLGTVLLAKIALAARVHHYGFALAAPATLLVVATLLARAPAAIARRGGDATLFRAGVLVFLALGLVVHLRIAAHWIAEKTVPVGSGADAFLADGRGPVVNETLREIAARGATGQTLAVLPEGVMLNYLARRRTSVRHLNFMPIELVMFGEETMLGELAAHPPDFVSLVHKDAAEYGARFFGHDYGRRLAAWVAQHYRPVAQHGAPPFVDERFGIVLGARKAD